LLNAGFSTSLSHRLSVGRPHDHAERVRDFRAPVGFVVANEAGKDRAETAA
jgi:hypothetical protein